MSEHAKIVQHPASTAKPTILEAAQTGTLELLVAMRDEIARQIDEGMYPRDLAPLIRRMLELQREIDGLRSGDGTDDVGVAAASSDDAWDAQAI